MTAWVVEDEAKLAEYLISDLRAEGFHVEHSSTIEGLLAVLRRKNFVPDVVVLDRLLRQHDSLAHLKEIKEAFPLCRILILSAINTSNEKASALDLGADDYLGK